MDFINIIYLIHSMHFRVNLKMKKPTLFYCFKWIVFIELNFTIASLLIRKTWDDWFAGIMGKWRILINGGILVMGGWYPFTDHVLVSLVSRFRLELMYISLIKSISSNLTNPWLSAAYDAAIIHRNHFFRFY